MRLLASDKCHSSGTAAQEEMKYQPGALQRIRDVEVDETTVIGDFVNLYECSIGADTVIGDFVEIGKTVSVGRRCRIGSHAYMQ